MGPQAGTENLFFEISQKNSGVHRQLCVSTCEMKSLAEVPAAGQQPTLLRPPVGTHSSGNTISWRVIAARKPKEPSAYGVCLQNNELLYYLIKYRAQLSEMLHPCRFGEESDRL